MTEKLKPCPFCGEIPEMEEDDIYAYEIICNNKKCKITPETGIWKYKKKCINIWNTRHGESDNEM